MNAPTSRWTAKDEANLVELVERKKRILEENIRPLRQAIEDSNLYELTGCTDVANALVANADKFYQALEPFVQLLRSSS